jgi:hypothetical protein
MTFPVICRHLAGPRSDRHQNRPPRVTPVLRSGHRERNCHPVRSAAASFQVDKLDCRSAVARLLDSFNTPTDVDPRE